MIVKSNQTDHWSNSWDKNFLIGGEYDVGASRRTSYSRKTPRTKEEILTTKPINWNILKPIMAFCNEKCNVMSKCPNGPNGDLRSKCNVNGLIMP